MRRSIKVLTIFTVVLVLALLLTNYSTSSQQYFNTIVAKEFILIDDNKTPRGALTFTDEGYPTVALFNNKGRDLIYMVIDNNGPAIRLMDDQGKPRLSLFLHEFSEPSIHLSDKNHKSFVSLSGYENEPGGRLMFVDENKGHRASIGYKNGKASLAIKGADKCSGAYLTAYDRDGVHINIADSNLRSNLTLRSTDNELAMVMAAQKRTGLFYRASRGDVPNLAIIKGGEPIWKALPGAPAPASDLPDIVDLIK